MNFPISVTQPMLAGISKLDRFRGRWSATRTIPRDRLARLREAVEIQSAAASCRLSGIRVTDAEVAGILRDPDSIVADAPVVRGYVAAMRRTLDVGSVLTLETLAQINAVVCGRESGASPLRTTTAQREAFDADGRAVGRVFSTLPPHLLESKLEDLTSWLEIELRSAERHPVPIVATFTLGFLAASPFEHGTGRTARVLLGLLLARAGYHFMPYASTEREMEDLRDEYHDAYDRSLAHFWNGEADLGPWIDFTLELLDRHRQRVEAKLELERSVLEFPPLQRMIMEAVQEHGTVDAALLLRATKSNRNTLKDNLRRLVQRGVLEKTGQRRGTRYRLVAADLATSDIASD